MLMVRKVNLLQRIAGGGGLWKMNVRDGRNMKGLKSQKNHYAGKCTYSEMSFSSETGGLPNTCKE